MTKLFFSTTSLIVLFVSVEILKTLIITSLNVSGYDQEIPQSHTADQPTAPRGRATEHL